MEIIYNPSVDVSKFPLSEDNLWNTNFANRQKFYLDKGQTKCDHNFIHLYYLNVPMILNRSFDIEKVGYRHEDGISYFDFPLDRSKAKEIKNNTKPTLTPDQLIIEYYYSFDGISEEEKEFYIYAPKIAVQTVISRHTNLACDQSTIKQTNDILLDGKKISGGERQVNPLGVYDFFNVITNYDRYSYLFDKFVANEMNHIVSKRKVTGLEDEIPNFTKEQFTKEYLEELHKVFKA